VQTGKPASGKTRNETAVAEWSIAPCVQGSKNRAKNTTRVKEKKEDGGASL